MEVKTETEKRSRWQSFKKWARELDQDRLFGRLVASCWLLVVSMLVAGLLAAGVTPLGVVAMIFTGLCVLESFAAACRRAFPDNSEDESGEVMCMGCMVADLANRVQALEAGSEKTRPNEALHDLQDAPANVA